MILHYILSTLLSILLTSILYKKTYNLFTYSNIEDFYVGRSIYLDHNKYQDLSVFFVYLIIFFIIFFLLKIFIKKDIKIKNLKLEPLHFPFENTLKKIQAIFLACYIFLHPFDGNIYPFLVILIIFFAIIGIIDIKKRNYETFSPWTIGGILFLIFYLQNPYNFEYITIDDHHLGESFATYFLHNKFDMKFYEDLMLVHGFYDIYPSLLGHFFFKEISLYTSFLGECLYHNLMFITVSIMGLYIFSKSYFFVIPIITRFPHFSIIYISAYILLMCKKITNKPFWWLILYTFLTYVFVMNWTTIGSFCFVATIPFAIYMLYEFIKSNENKKWLKLALLISFITALYGVSFDILNSYYTQAIHYIKGNLLAFGNGFGEYNFTLEETIYYGINLFVIIVSPYFISELLNQIKKEKKDIKNILFLTFIVVFPLVSLSYILGRIDGNHLQRICNISTTYLCLVLPFYLYKKYPEQRDGQLKLLMQIICIIYLIFVGIQLTNKGINLTTTFSISNLDKIRIENIKNFVEKHSNSENDFLDLSNRGMNYMYLEKKIPVPYTSYYNSISTQQANISLKKIKEVKPKVIFLGFYNKTNDYTQPVFDNVYPSLRIYPIYKWILEDGHYEIVKEKGNIYFLRKENKINYLEEDKNVLDKLFSTNKLEYLPEVWGNSTKTLQMEKQNIEFTQNKNIKITTIVFEQKTNLNDINLLEIICENKVNSFVVELDNEKTKIKLKTKKNGKLLIPLDSIPSWLLKEEIKEIKIYEENETKIPYKVAFYKRR